MASVDKRAKALGLNCCGECRFWKNSSCDRTQLKFPALKSDIVCGEFVQNKK